MKILFVSNQFPSKKYPYKGSFIYTQAKELQKKLDNIVVLAPNYGNEEKISIYKDIKLFRFRTFTKPTSDPLLRNLFKGFNGLFALLLFILIQTVSIIKISRREKIDLIHAHWILPSGFSSFLASIIIRKKFVITTNGSDLTCCGTNKILKIFVCFILSRTPTLICVSDKLRIIANQVCGKKIPSKTIFIGIPNYQSLREVSVRQIDQISNKKTIKFIFVGSLYPLKGIKFLLESILILSKKRKNFILNIIGGGGKLLEYEAFVKNNHLESFVYFHGFKSHNEALNIISESDIAVQASLSEGLSIFIQESVFFGKAIIATNVGGTNEIVIDGFNGLLIDPENSIQLAEKMEYLMLNIDKIQDFSKNSIEIADEKLSLQQNMDNVINIYKKLLK